MGVRKAARKELKVLSIHELGLTEAELTSRTVVEEVFLPPVTNRAQFLEGDAAVIADNILRIINEHVASQS